MTRGHTAGRRVATFWLRLATALAVLLSLSAGVSAREREPNSSYAERRAKLRAQLDGPVVLFGFTGREDASPSYVFGQEENFYYLTGHNEPGAALVLLPDAARGGPAEGASEILFLPARNLDRERWDSPRLGPADPGIAERTGFAAVMEFSRLQEQLARHTQKLPRIYTLLPGRNDSGYPHARNWNNWLQQAVPSAELRAVFPAIAAMRQLKSPTELALLQRVTDLSIDAHLEAMRMMRPGLYEYEIAARMEFTHKSGGCERESYAPIVGAGFNSTVLHYNGLRKRIEDGDIVVLDVGGEFSGYAADITRTLPANGKFTKRQREIYEIVLGAQNAALAALKPGVMMGGQAPGNLTQIAREYMNAHGKDSKGEPLGKYFIHGLGHQVGLNVHDPATPGRALEPGMVVTIEPGIYIPEENLGARIEDMVLVTETGYKLLTARLPRTVVEIEKIMADGRASR